MAIDKAMIPNPDLVGDDTLQKLIELDIGAENPGGAVTLQEDGSAVVDLDEGAENVMADTSNVPFDANLAEYMAEEDLRSLGHELVAFFEADKNSRTEWEEMYKKGMEYLGTKIENMSEPFQGACGVQHPVLAEAAVRFQAQAIKAILPAEGPVRAKILGESTPAKDEQARRVRDYMNYTLTEQLEEYRVETERLLFSLPLAGSAFRKVYFDRLKNRPASMYVPAEDLVVSYGLSDLDGADRFTQISRLPTNEVRKNQVTEFWRTTKLKTSFPTSDSVQQKIDEITGRSDVTGYEKDSRHEILEMHVDLDLKGFEDESGIMLPYVVTIERDTADVLAIRRNWKEDDPTRLRRSYFVHYQFVPGLGFYGFGLVHLIGGLTYAATSIVRQLVDSGTFSNFPGGLKTRNIRDSGDPTPLQPGEWRDVDVTMGTLRDNLFPLPYKEPSATLFQLLGALVDDARRLASTADMKVSDMNNEAPVGTTLAIIERATLVQSSVQARLHDSLKKEFKLLAQVIVDYTEPQYPYEVREGQQIKVQDFDARVDIIPVSDPNASTLAQRIMQYQAALQLASQAPNIYNMQALHRQVIDAIGIPEAEKIIPGPQEIPPTDPVTENMNAMNLRPMRAYEHQDHEAHLRVHVALSQDPQFLQMTQNSPQGPALRAALDAHVREHMAFMYRRQIEEELGTPLPPLGQPVPEDVEKRLSTLSADAADELLGKKQAMALAEERAAAAEDPIIQQKERELDLREADVMRKMAADVAKKDTDDKKVAADLLIEQAKLEAEQDKASNANLLEGMKLGVDVMKDISGNEQKAQDRDSKKKSE